MSARHAASVTPEALRTLDALDTVDLEQLNAEAELQTRVDRKYMLPIAALPALLERLPDRVRVPDIDGNRASSYESVYFDTPELTSFRLAAHARRRRRFKIRTRSYVDSDASFLEVTAGGGAGAGVAADASAKGLKGTVSVIVDGGSVAVDAAEDTVHSDSTVHLANGEVTLASGDDGGHAEAALTVSGGTLAVTESHEALEAAAVAIAGGSTAVIASDDGVNAGSTLEITGGALEIDAEGDGLDSNGTIAMSAGTVVVNGPSGQGNGALDVDGGFDITGGTLLAGGSSGMAMAPDADAAQASVLVTFTQQVAAGTELEVTASDGTVVATYTATKTISSLAVSTADLVNGETYTVGAGGSSVGSAVAGEQVAGMGGGPGGGAMPPRG